MTLGSNPNAPTMEEHSVEVTFKNGMTGKYTFAKDLQSWEKHFVDLWKKHGHKVKIVPVKAKK